MKDPHFLLDEGATALERRLLEAGAREQPSAACREAALSAIGLGTGVALASAGAAAASASAAKDGLGWALSKWWLIGGGLLAAAGSAVWAMWPAETVAPLTARAPMVEATARSLPLQGSVGPAPVTQAEPPTLAPSAAPAASERRPQPAARSSGDASIQGQIDLIDRARNAVRAHQPATALQAVSEYYQRYPQGVLGQEAQLLRIEAVLQQGDRATAERMFDSYEARYPNSALAARVRRLLGR